MLQNFHSRSCSSIYHFKCCFKTAFVINTKFRDDNWFEIFTYFPTSNFYVIISHFSLSFMLLMDLSATK